MVEEILADTSASMDKAIESFQRDLAKIRTGRANTAILDGIRIDYYGTPTPLNQCSAITVVDPRLISIKPWDRGSLNLIEKAIIAADIGITPTNKGDQILLPIPPLTGERRKELVKLVKRDVEDCKVAIRNVRRDANEMLEAVDNLPEDDFDRAKKKVQDITDDKIKRADEIASKKEKEIVEL